MPTSRPTTKQNRNGARARRLRALRREGPLHGPDLNHHRLACELRIRPYKPADFRALNAIWKAGDISRDETDTFSAIQQNIDRGRYRIFVAEARMVDAHTNRAFGKPRLAGGAITTFDGHRAYIYHFAVHRDFRGRGVGRALLQTCERQAQFWGARHLRLTSRTDASRASARKLYEALGWSRDDGVRVYQKTLD